MHTRTVEDIGSGFKARTYKWMTSSERVLYNRIIHLVVPVWNLRTNEPILTRSLSLWGEKVFQRKTLYVNKTLKIIFLKQETSFLTSDLKKKNLWDLNLKWGAIFRIVNFLRRGDGSAPFFCLICFLKYYDNSWIISNVLHSARYFYIFSS